MAYKVNQELAQQSVNTSADRLSRSGGDNDLKWYDMKVGANRLRFLPPWNAHGILAFERFHHFIANGNVVTCLNTFKDTAWAPPEGLPECPICQALEELNGAGHDVSGKWPRFNAYFNVIDLDNVAGGVQVCRLPTTPFNNLMQFQSVPEIGDFTDPLSGFNILVTKTGEGLDTKYAVTLLPVRSPIYSLADGTPDIASIEALVGSEADPDNNQLFPIDRIWSCPDATGLAELTGKSIALKSLFLGTAVAPTPNQPIQPQVPAPVAIPAVPAPIAPVATPAPVPAPIAPVATPVPVATPAVPAPAPIAPVATVVVPPPPVSSNVPTGQMAPAPPQAAAPQATPSPVATPPPPVTAVPPTPAPPAVATPGVAQPTAKPEGSPDCFGITFGFNPVICNPCQFSDTCKLACGK